MFSKKHFGGATAQLPFPGCDLLDDKHMLNIEVLVRTNDLRGLRVPAFAGRVRFELGARQVACGIRNPLCGSVNVAPVHMRVT